MEENALAINNSWPVKVLLFLPTNIMYSAKSEVKKRSKCLFDSHSNCKLNTAFKICTDHFAFGLPSDPGSQKLVLGINPRSSKD